MCVGLAWGPSTDLGVSAPLASAGIDHPQVADLLLVATIDNAIRIGNCRVCDAPGENSPEDCAWQEPAAVAELESTHRLALSLAGTRLHAWIRPCLFVRPSNMLRAQFVDPTRARHR
jgi:hypothetical protein